MPVSGGALLVTAVGGLFLYSGIRGSGVLTGIQTVVQGQSPANLPQTTMIGGTPTVATGAGDIAGGIIGQSGAAPGDAGSGSAAHIALQAAATLHGWGSGAQWTALDTIENQEAGYDSTATNPSSKAYGLAQSLGHGFPGGPAPNGINEYGGNGLSTAESYAASMGDPVPQAKWMCNYIANRYGNPVVAEQFHLANGWY